MFLATFRLIKIPHKPLLQENCVKLSKQMSTCTFARPVADDFWKSTHNKYVRKAQEASKNINFVLIGDSIIERMQMSTLWSEKIKKLGCLNFGIGGDRVENVLWRMENGELDLKTPIKGVVVFVGTNNVDCSPAEIFEGILKLVETVKAKLEEVPVVLPTLLPKGQYPNPYRTKNEKVNEMLLEKYTKETNKGVHLVPIHENVTEKDGTISNAILYDYLHLTDLAYSKIFEPVYQKLCLLLNKQ